MRAESAVQSKQLLQLILAAAVITAGCSNTNQQPAATNNNRASMSATTSAGISPAPISSASSSPGADVTITTAAPASSPPGTQQSGTGSATHGEMMKSAPGAANAPYDLQFLDTMAAHHAGAVEMAQLAETKAQHPELKEFAQRIIADQTKEIKQMEQWRAAWYANQPKAENIRMPGMLASMKGMSMDPLRNASGPVFDTIFINMMVPHHQGAIVMAKDALTKAEHPELKRLAEAIITAQRNEIAQMSQWQLRWSMQSR